MRFFKAAGKSAGTEVEVATGHRIMYHKLGTDSSEDQVCGVLMWWVTNLPCEGYQYLDIESTFLVGSKGGCLFVGC